jgi:hypothetical protein
MAIRLQSWNRLATAGVDGVGLCFRLTLALFGLCEESFIGVLLAWQMDFRLGQTGRVGHCGRIYWAVWVECLHTWWYLEASQEHSILNFKRGSFMKSSNLSLMKGLK